MKPTRRVVFRVEVRISDRWNLIDGADALAQPEAHALHAAKVAILGADRVRMIPVRPPTPKGTK
jgi:hypothetical protein